MTEPAEKQRRYNDYISRFSDVRERELRMVHDVCEAESDRDAAISWCDQARAELRELKHKLEGRP